jgi:hypothetical protein
MSQPAAAIPLAGAGPPDPLPDRVAATARVLGEFARDRRTPWLPAAKLHALRDARARALVRHAAEYVPHYRDLFEAHGIDAEDVASADDLRELPLLDKETVQRDDARFRSTSPEATRTFAFPTSGSSGTPLMVFHEPAALFRYLAVGERRRAVVRALLGRGRHRTVTIARSNSTGARTRATLRRLTLLPARPERARVSPESSVEEMVAVLAERRPDVVAGWGNSLESLFRLAAAGEIRIPLPRLVDYHAEAMSDEGRRLIEHELGIPVTSNLRLGRDVRDRLFLRAPDGLPPPRGRLPPPRRPGRQLGRAARRARRGRRLEPRQPRDRSAELSARRRRGAASGLVPMRPHVPSVERRPRPGKRDRPARGRTARAPDLRGGRRSPGGSAPVSPAPGGTRPVRARGRHAR